MCLKVRLNSGGLDTIWGPSKFWGLATIWRGQCCPTLGRPQRGTASALCAACGTDFDGPVVLSLALASAMLTLFYSEPLGKTSPNSRKHRTSSPVSLPVLLNLVVHVQHLQQLHWLPIKHRIDVKNLGFLKTQLYRPGPTTLCAISVWYG